MQDAGWNPADIRGAAAGVEFVNTNGTGSADSYSQIVCPAGHIFPGFEVDRSYIDCDVFVSIPKMKEHHWFGATLSMKNCYGMTPLTIYGDAAGVDGPGTEALGTRVGILHNGDRAPSLSAPQEIDPDSPRAGDYRLWPGPNSNSFTAAILRAVPELGASPPSNAIGRDYRDGFYAGLTDSRTGFELNLHGLAALKVGWVEGLEVQSARAGGRARSASSGRKVARLWPHRARMSCDRRARALASRPFVPMLWAAG